MILSSDGGDMPESRGLIDALQSMLGGGLTAFLSALAGRLMWHASEVQAKRRPVLCISLLWEMPLAFGMALIGDGLGMYLDLPRGATVGLIVVLAYLGPRGAAAILERWLAARKT